MHRGWALRQLVTAVVTVLYCRRDPVKKQLSNWRPRSKTIVQRTQIYEFQRNSPLVSWIDLSITEMNRHEAPRNRPFRLNETHQIKWHIDDFLGGGQQT